MKKCYNLRGRIVRKLTVQQKAMFMDLMKVKRDDFKIIHSIAAKYGRNIAATRTTAAATPSNGPVVGLFRTIIRQNFNIAYLEISGYGKAANQKEAISPFTYFYLPMHHILTFDFQFSALFYIARPTPKFFSTSFCVIAVNIF